MKNIDLDKPHKFFFETLSNQARWDIIHLLQKKSHRVTDIAKELNYEQSLVSHHLKRLGSCGFVTFTENGNERIYNLNKETIEPLIMLMDKHINKFCKELCCKT